MENELTDIVNKVARLHERIEKLLARIDIASLPSFTLDSLSSIKALPEHAGDLYFLTHSDQGLLYIGKAYDFRKRFQFHEIIAATMTLGGVTLSWLKLPGEFNTLCEEIFIAERAPRWNKQIPFRSIEHRMDRLNQQLRQEHAYDRGLRANEASDEEGEREETDIGKVICRYCDMEYMKRGLRRHQRTCDLRPSWERGRRDQGSH